MKKNRQSGYDMVLNAPMSVSLLLSVASEEEKAAILSAQRRSVGCLIRDGMGALVDESDLHELPILEPGTALLGDIQPEHILIWGKTGNGMTSAYDLRSPKQRSKDTHKKGRRS